MFNSAQELWSKLLDNSFTERATANTLKIDLRFLRIHNPTLFIKQANAMISKSLGKLHKVRA